MPLPYGVSYRIKTKADGTKVRIAVSPNGRILEVKRIGERTAKTRTGKRLARRLRRIRR